LYFRYVGPFAQLCQLVHEENTFALSSVCRLHDPGYFRCALELLLEEIVITWELVSQRHNIQVNKGTRLVALSKWGIFFLHFFHEALDVLDHQVLPSKLQVIGVVIYKSKKKLVLTQKITMAGGVSVLTDFH
jgi:hypothetical protein